MSRFVLRYNGAGAVSTQRALKSVAAAGARVLDVAGPMVLVECGQAAAKSLRDALPDWQIVAERKVMPRPKQPRPRLRQKVT